MKLAEALNVRADLQKNIERLRHRLEVNAKVQEGETPSENPSELLEELDNSILELEKLIKAINKTNNNTYIENENVVDLIAKRDCLALKLSIMRDLVNSASQKIDRYSSNEIKTLSTINISQKQKEIDKLSKEHRIIDTKLQGLNWITDLME